MGSLMLLVIPVLWSCPGGEVLTQTITVRGASQFADDHSSNQTVLRFAEQVQKYYGKPINLILHRTRDPGHEKEYFMYMSQGLSEDYGRITDYRCL